MQRTILKKTVIIAIMIVGIACVANAQTQVPEIEMVSVQGNGAINSFNMAKYAVTQGQWKAIMGNNPSDNKSSDNHPVEMVNWYDAREFISKLNALSGKNYRLPSEAEWEYAARGGTKSQGYEYSGGNNIDDVGWYYGNSNGKSQPVGTKQPNELGIYDMSGNVNEWCSDESSGSLRSVRGGGWDSAAAGCKIAEHDYYTVSGREINIGFRLVHP